MKNICKYSFMFFALFFLLCSCSTTKKLPSNEQEKLRTMKPVTNKALVYVMRPTSFGLICDLPVHVNGKSIGSTGPKTFLYASLEPGNYKITSIGENEVTLPIQLEGGQIYFIQQQIKMGIGSCRTQLKRLKETEGRLMLKKCNYWQPKK